MEKQLQEVFTTHNISPHRNQGILIVPVIDQAQGIRITKDILYKLIDKKTALFLSGGKTPKEILRQIAREKKLEVGVVGQVDERYGQSMHENANELMFEQSGFLSFLTTERITFHSMLTTSSGKNRELLAEAYDSLLRSLFTVYQRSVATLGIGSDGHIAGIAPTRTDFTNPLFHEESEQKLVSSFYDRTGAFGERITMTFLGLSMMDVLLPIVMGEDKKTALEKLFEDGKEEDIPARFLKRKKLLQKQFLSQISMFDFVLSLFSEIGLSSPKAGVYVFSILALIFMFFSFITETHLWVVAIICCVIALACLMIELAN